MPQTDLTPPVSCTVQAKAILAGEHFVLHGLPAIAAPVPGYNLTLRLALRTWGELVIPEPHHELALEVSAILDHRLDGFVRLSITSAIPQGAGLGSSAAFAVAFGRALCEQAGFSEEESSLRSLKIANLIEHQIHHGASGIDTATVHAGVPIRFYIDEQGQKKVEAIEIAKPVTFLLIDSGQRRATHAQIKKVRAQREMDPKQFKVASEEARTALDELSDGLRLNDTDRIQRSIDTTGQLLKSLGLEHAASSPVRALADSKNVALKITGAGGGGYMLAFASNENDLNNFKEALPTHLKTHAFTLQATHQESDRLPPSEGVHP